MHLDVVHPAYRSQGTPRQFSMQVPEQKATPCNHVTQLISQDDHSIHMSEVTAKHKQVKYRLKL